MAAELKREVALRHLLYPADVTALAWKVGCDDVVFGLNGSASVAFVQLSYGKADDFLPQTQVFSSLEAWKEQQHP